MSIYITKSVQRSSRVEAFDKRGLHGQVSCKAADSGVSVVGPADLINALKFNFVVDELAAIEKRRIVLYGSTKMMNILQHFGGFEFEAPTLMVDMKTGGEVLNALGMFEVGSGRIGSYVGKPTINQLRQISPLGLDFYSTVPAGNVNLAGYITFIVAWRAIRAFYSIGAGHSGTGSQNFVVSEEVGTRLSARAAVDKMVGEDGSVVREAVAGKAAGGFIKMSDLSPVTEHTSSQGGIRILESISPTAGALGHIFPYFREMLESDAEATFNIFIRYFNACFSDSDEEFAQAVVLYRRGFRYLASTHAGRILQHIFFGMICASSLVEGYTLFEMEQITLGSSFRPIGSFSSGTE